MKTYCNLLYVLISILAFTLKVNGQEELDQKWGTGLKLSKKDSVKLERMMIRHDINAKEHEALAMGLSGERLSAKQQRYFNKGMQKIEKIREIAHKFQTTHHKKIQTKKTRQQMKRLEQNRKKYGYNNKKSWWKKFFKKKTWKKLR